MKKLTVSEFTKAPQQIKKTHFIAAPIESVWQIVADHQGMTQWVPMIKQVDLVKEDRDGHWGEGSERHCQFGPDLLQEKIVHWDPPYGYAYMIGDMHLVKDHLGHLQLSPTPEGTTITWTQYFQPNGNFLKRFMAKNVMMPNVMSKALKNLSKKVA